MSPQGKEAVVAIFERGSFFGEAWLAGEAVRLATTTALGRAEIVRLEKQAMIKVLHEESAFSELFMSYLLSRNIRIQEDLVDQLFNSREKRLARVLLLLAHFGKEEKPEAVMRRLVKKRSPKWSGRRVPA